MARIWVDPDDLLMAEIAERCRVAGIEHVLAEEGELSYGERDQIGVASLAASNAAVLSESGRETLVNVDWRKVMVATVVATVRH